MLCFMLYEHLQKHTITKLHHLCHARSPLPLVKEKPLHVVQEKLKTFNVGQAFGASILPGIWGIHLARNQIVRAAMLVLCKVVGCFILIFYIYVFIPFILCYRFYLFFIYGLSIFICEVLKFSMFHNYIAHSNIHAPYTTIAYLQIL